MTLIHNYTPFGTQAVEKNVGDITFENHPVEVDGKTYQNRSIVYAWHGAKHRIPIEFVVSIEED